MTIALVLAMLVLLAAGGLWVWRRGREAERDNIAAGGLDAARKAREIDDEIDGMSEDAIRDSARRRVAQRDRMRRNRPF